MAVLNLVLFLLFSGLYISRGIQLELLDPLHQAEDRLARKIEDGELQLDCFCGLRPAALFKSGLPPLRCTKSKTPGGVRRVK